MKKTLLTLVLTLIGIHTANAQVGIGTETPKTSLQVVGTPTSSTTADGVQVPSLSLAQLDAKITAYGTDQNGAIVFIDDVSTNTSTTETASIDAVGFYYYDAVGDTWKVLSNTSTLADGSVTSAKILDGAIVNADISASAAIAQSKIDGLSVSLSDKADLASPTFTGTPTLPTGTIGVTQTAGNNTTAVATTEFVATAVAGVTDPNFDLSGAIDGDLLQYDATASKWVKVTPDYISNGDTNVGFGTTTPKASAALEIKSTTQGLLPPRMTQAERNLIGTPAQGLMIYCTDCGTNGEAQLYNGIAWTTMTGGETTAAFACGDNVTFSYNGSSVTYGTIAGAGTNCWLDRNLGASQLAGSSTDYLAYGDLYQWGRGADGHQTIVWTSKTESAEQNNQINTLSTKDTPGHGDFIITSNSPFDWRNPQNDNLWQGVDGVNNPCPTGYRVPTEAEWQAELGTGKITNAQSAFDILKLPIVGFRDRNSGSLNSGSVGTRGFYWSSTVSGYQGSNLPIDSSSATMTKHYRAHGFSVRCLKD